MERTKTVMVRLSEDELAALEVLVHGGSRGGYFRHRLQIAAAERVSYFDTVIEGFAASAKICRSGGADPGEFEVLIRQWGAERESLKRVANPPVPQLSATEGGAE